MYSFSVLDPAKEFLRERSFTTWMSPDLKQAAVAFCKSVGLVPIYAETREDGKTRYLFWKPPTGTAFEVRSGYTKTYFEKFHGEAELRGMLLLSLHVCVCAERFHSAVWVSMDATDAAIKFLEFFGIAPSSPSKEK